MIRCSCKIISTVVLVFLVVSCNSDSVLEEETNQRLIHLRFLLEESSKLIASENYAEANNTLDSAEAICLELSNDTLFSRVLNNRGLIKYRAGEFDESISFYQASLEMDRQANDSVGMAIKLKNIGISHKQKGNFQKSLSFYQGALSIVILTKDSAQIASVNNSIGNIYNDLGEYDEAIEFLENAKSVWNLLGDSLKLSYALGNLGNSFLGLGRIQDAIDNHKRALAIKYIKANESSIAISLNNLGEAHLERGDIQTAKGYFEQSLELRLKIGAKNGEAVVSNNLADAEIRGGNLKEARKWLDRARRVSELSGARDIKLRTLKLEKELFARAGNYQKAFEADLLFDELKQIAFDEEVLKVRELQFDFDLDREEQAKLAAQNQRDLFEARADAESLRAEIQTYFIGLALVIIVLVSYFAYRLRKKNHHIENLIRELHHRVKNHLGMISGMFVAQSEEMPGENAAVLDEAKTRVEAVNGIHRRLYRQDEYEYVNMQDYLTELVDNNALIFGLLNKIEKQLEIDSEPLDIDKAISVGLIANEVLTNAFKYGLQKTQEPVLKIVLEKVVKGYRMIIFNNVNHSEAGSEGTGFGSELIKRLTQNLKGTTTINQENGFQFELTFP